MEYAANGFKGNVDTEITLHLVAKTSDYKEIVLVSGDGDFVPVVQYLRKNQKKIYTLSTKGHIKSSLLKSTYYFDLSWIKEKLA